MARKRRKSGHPWWRQRKWQRRFVVLAAVAAAVGVFLVVAALIGGGGKEPTQNVSGPAPPFSLPTTGGDQVSLADHAGQHALLLYFNEGVG